MFLASDQAHHRESRVRRYLNSDPSVSLLLAAVNFEWTLSRALLFPSPSTNSELRERMGDCYGLDAYKDMWRDEVSAPRNVSRLADVVRNWSSIREAFRARGRLVHGRDRYTRNMAVPHIEALLKGAANIDSFCESLGSPLHLRMPVRRKRRKSSACSDRSE